MYDESATVAVNGISAQQGMLEVHTAWVVNVSALAGLTSDVDAASCRPHKNSV